MRISLTCWSGQSLVSSSQIVADPTVGNQTPTVLQAPNGVPLVHIAPPSAAGVSHNAYQQFDVNAEGAILNNARTITQTQLGGYIPGNANLANGTARITLNEVTSALESNLRGYVEVAGQGAEVIIANPNGITCAGCGFINTSRSLLTTGVPVFGGSGSLDAFRVTRGQINMDRLNAGNVDQIDVLARAVQVNGKWFANQLNVITGANQVGYADLGIQTIDGKGSAPAVSLDVSQLGGMYANKIRLVGTEAGVGVNHQGIMAAQAGELTLSSAGHLTQTGKIHATGDLKLDVQGDMISTGEVLGQQTVHLSAQEGNLDLSGSTMRAAQSLVASAGRTLRTDRAQVSADQLTLKGQSFSNRGGRLSQTGAADTVIDVAQAFDNAGGTLATNADNLHLRAGSFSNVGGDVTHAGAGMADLVVTQALDNRDGKILTHGTLAIDSGRLVNHQGTLQGQSADVRSAETLDNSRGKIISTNDLRVAAADIDNTVGAIQSDGDITVASHGALNNVGGRIEANSDHSALNVSAEVIDNRDGRIANAGRKTTTVTAVQRLDNTGAGLLGGNGDVDLHTPVLNNTRGAKMSAGRHLMGAATESLDNSGGHLTAGGDIRVEQAGASLINRNGHLQAGGHAVLHAASLDNEGGNVAAQGDAQLTGALVGEGRLAAGNDITLNLVGDFVNGLGNQWLANRNLLLSTLGKLTNRGTFGAVQRLHVMAGSIDNQVGAKLLGATTELNAGAALLNAGRIEGDVVRGAASTLQNTGGIVGGDVTLQANRIDNAGATALIASTGPLKLYARDTLLNQGGATTYSLGDLAIAADGTRDADGLLANRTDTVHNDRSTLEAGQNLEIAAQTLINARPEPTVQATTTTESKHLTKRAPYQGSTQEFPYSKWPNGSGSNWDIYKNGSHMTLAKSSVVSRNEADKKIVYLDANGVERKLYFNTVTEAGDALKIRYWDAYDPAVNFDPATEYGGIQGPSHHFLVETARTSTIKTVMESEVNPQPVPHLLAGQSMTLANVGRVRNAYGIIAAGDTLQIGRVTSTGEIAPGAYGTTQVENLARTLTRQRTFSDVSEYTWNAEWWGADWRQVQQPLRVEKPAVVGEIKGQLTANKRLNVYAGNISNTNVNAGDPLAGGAHTLTASTSIAASVPSLTVLQPAISLPAGGLFQVHPNPGQRYLVETDPRFTNYRTFLSSDYQLATLGFDPAMQEKRLGDGFYEQRRVRDQISELTGRHVLPGYTDAEAQFKALMNNGVTVAKSFQLTPGIALNEAQMAALTSDIVWLVEQTVTLPDGSTQTVWTPQVYLAATRTADVSPTGALMAADDIQLYTQDSLANSGVIRGGSRAQIAAGQDIVNRGGTVTSRDVTVMQVGNDLINASGVIDGKRVALIAGRDVIHQTLIDEAGVTASVGHSTASTSLIGQRSMITSQGSLAVRAGRDLTMTSAAVSAADGAALTASRNLTVDTQQAKTTTGEDRGANDYWKRTTTEHIASGLSTGGALSLVSGGDTHLKGAQVAAGSDLNVAARGHLTVTAVTNETVFDQVNRSEENWQSEEHSRNQAVQNANLAAGGNIALTAGVGSAEGDLTLTGANVTATAGTAGQPASQRGTVTLTAADNIHLIEARESHERDYQQMSQRGIFISSTTEQNASTTHQTLAVGSSVSGERVVVSAGQDINVRGSAVVGTDGVDLAAVGRVNITAAQNHARSEQQHEKTESGFLGGGFALTIGQREKQDELADTSITHAVSTVASLNGTVNVQSGADVQVSGSDLYAGKDLRVQGQNVTLDTAYDIARQTERHVRKQSGISFGFGGGVIDTIREVVANLQRASEVKDDRLKAVKTAQAAYGAYRLGGMLMGGSGGAAPAGPDGANGAQGAGGGASVRLQVSVGSSKSESESHSAQQNARSTTLTAGGNVQLEALGERDAQGNAIAGTGDLTLVGSQVRGKAVQLSATNDILLQSAQSRASQHGENSSSGFMAGVGLSLGQQTGIAIFASANQAKGNADGNAITHVNTEITGTEQVNIQSGNDTTLAGAQVSGQQVKAEIGGNLTLASRQDTDDYTSRQSGASAGASGVIGYGGGSASVGWNRDTIDSTYASVNPQTGIVTGEGGFDIQVTKHTQLDGAIISSTADETKNRLSTETLGFSDIKNHAAYEAQSTGVSAGWSGASSLGGNAAKNALANGVSGLGLGNTSGEASGTTRAAISAGTLEVRNDAQTGLDSTAGLSRDTANANQSIQKIFNLQAVQETMELGREFGKLGMQLAGDLADRMDREYTKAVGDQNAALEYGVLKERQSQGELDAAGQARLAQYEQNQWTPEYASKLAAQATTTLNDPTVQATHALWGANGAGRMALHAGVSAVGAGMTGGNVGGAIAGTLAGDAASHLLKDAIQEATRGLTPSVQTTVANLVTNVVAGAAGAVAGGAVGGKSGAVAGAGGAMEADRYNRQLHSEEYAKAKQYAKAVAKALHISEQEAEGRIVAEMLRNSDKQVAEASGGKHDYDIRKIVGCQNLNCKGDKNDAQYANHNYNSQYIVPNQRTYDLGQKWISTGLTYDELVTKNIQNNPVGATLAGVGMIGVGYLTGGVGTAIGIKMFGAGVGAATNYIFQSGPTDWRNVGISAATGFLATGSGLGSSIVTNVGGSMFGSGIKGENPNSGIAGATVGTVAGYGIGKAIKIPAEKIIDPRGWWTPDWISLGYGVSKWNTPSAVPGMLGVAGSSISQEPIGNATKDRGQGVKK